MKINLDSYSSFFYLAFSMLLSKKPNSVLPELMYVMEPKDLMTFLDMFGGHEVYIPSREELSFELQTALAAYLRYVEKKSDAAIQETLEVDGNKFRAMNSRISSYLKFIKQEGVLPAELLRGAVDV